MVHKLMRNTTAAILAGDHTIRLRRLHCPEPDKPQTYHLII